MTVKSLMGLSHMASVRIHERDLRQSQHFALFQSDLRMYRASVIGFVPRLHTYLPGR
jgi:hypothetical protein